MKHNNSSKTLNVSLPQVQKTGTNLETFSTTLKDVERCLSLQEADQLDTSSVMDVLDSMSTVKNEYAHLRQDLQEVQQLQKEMATTLQYQMRSMTQTYNILKKRIESTTNLPIPMPQNPAVALRRPHTAPPRAISSVSSSPPSN